jgi:hypothetical protein
MRRQVGGDYASRFCSSGLQALGFWFELPWPSTDRRNLVPKGVSYRSWRWFAAELSCALWRGGSVLAVIGDDGW